MGTGAVWQRTQLGRRAEPASLPGGGEDVFLPPGLAKAHSAACDWQVPAAASSRRASLATEGGEVMPASEVVAHFAVSGCGPAAAAASSAHNPPTLNLSPVFGQTKDAVFAEASRSNGRRWRQAGKARVPAEPWDRIGWCMIDGCGNSSEVRRHPRLVLAFPAHVSRLALSFGIVDGFSHSLSVCPD